jgi:hypothetical protein
MALFAPYGFLFASVSGILASSPSFGAFLIADFVTVMWAFFSLKFTKSGLFKVFFRFFHFWIFAVYHICSEGLFFSLESIFSPQKALCLPDFSSPPMPLDFSVAENRHSDTEPSSAP